MLEEKNSQLSIYTLNSLLCSDQSAGRMRIRQKPNKAITTNHQRNNTNWRTQVLHSHN